MCGREVTLVYCSLFAALLLVGTCTGVTCKGGDSITLRPVSSTPVVGGVEIVGYDASASRIHAIGRSGYMRFGLNDAGEAELLNTQIFSNTLQWEATSIAIDPKGRGFAVVSWIPDPTDSVPGIAQIINLESGDPVWQLNIGYHPDCLMFTPDGNYLFAANECEPRETNRVGAITVLDLRGIRTSIDFAGFKEAATYELKDANLGEGVDLSSLRIAPEYSDTPGVDIEPEYIAADNAGAWVTLQENNGMAYFDLQSRKWTRVLPLGMLSFAFDGSESDGIKLIPGHGFGLLPLPDTIVRAEINGHGYLVVANEGEKSDNHSMRLGEAINKGLVDADAIDRVLAQVDDFKASGYDQLYISTIDGDLDGDGDLDVLCPLGGRSVSILDAQTGIVIWNSGPQIELLSGMLFPERYNAGDSRSDHAGPEPEGVAVASLSGRTLMAIGLERVDAVMLYDISDPYAPVFLDAKALGAGCESPEGMHFYSVEGHDYLVVGGEIGGCISVFEVLSCESEKPVSSETGLFSR